MNEINSKHGLLKTSQCDKILFKSKGMNNETFKTCMNIKLNPGKYKDLTNSSILKLNF